MHSKCAEEVRDLFKRSLDPGSRITQVLNFLDSQMEKPDKPDKPEAPRASKKTTSTKKDKAA